VVELRLFRKLIAIAFSLIIIFTNNFSFASTPDISGNSNILIEAKSGRILYSKNPHQKLPMASTTKIMTALIAIEYGNLDDKVKIEKKSVGIEGSSIYLYEGEEIYLRDLVYGLILRSGNDAAVAIANHISGSVDNFAVLMNKKAKEIGAENTNFTNPSGLHSSNHYTTAYDLALISREAMKSEEFKKISASKLWVSNREVNKYFYNKNKTLWQYEGGDGIKIGYTTAAGRCLVSSATRNEMQLIAVVLNDPNWFNDCYKLFDYGFENYKPTVLYSKGQFIQSIYIPNGKKTTLPVIIKDTLLLPLTEGEEGEIKTVISIPKEIYAPIWEGQKIGSIQIFLKGQLIYTEDLIAKDSVKEKGNINKLFNFINRIFN